MDFQIELRLLIAKFFPGFADLPRCSSFDSLVERPTTIVLDCKRSGRAQDAVPTNRWRRQPQADDLPRFFGPWKALEEELLLNAPDS